jgi:hypothetical protein
MTTSVRPKTDRRKTTRADVAPTVNGEAIARRAFELYCARGGQHGQDVQDWLAAERELAAAAVQPRRKAAPKRAAQA